jgi:hypothetical protein
MRIRLRQFRSLAALLLPILGIGLLAPAPVVAAGAEWRAVPSVGELHLRFEASGQAAPCALLGAAPDASTIECWVAHVDRSVARRSSPLTEETTLACVVEWEIEQPGKGSCPADTDRCVRPDVGLFDSLTHGLPIDTNIATTWALTADLATQYTVFHALRNGRALNPHRPRLAGLALSQGMLVLYRAHAITLLRHRLEEGGCGTQHLESYFALAAQVTDELGRSDVPEILETFPPAGREWERRFHRVQLAVTGRGGRVSPTGRWREDCEKAAAVGRQVGRLDADVNVWCGYAYEQLDMPEAAFEHWRLARRSPNHLEAASYANRRLRIEPTRPTETTAEVR